jgi:hypothetical protein
MKNILLLLVACCFFSQCDFKNAEKSQIPINETEKSITPIELPTSYKDDPTFFGNYGKSEFLYPSYQDEVEERTQREYTLNEIHSMAQNIIYDAEEIRDQAIDISCDDAEWSSDYAIELAEDCLNKSNINDAIELMHDAESEYNNAESYLSDCQ